MKLTERIQHTNEKCALWLHSQPERIAQQFHCNDQRYARMTEDSVQALAMATGLPMRYLVQEIGFGSLIVPHLVVISFDENVAPYLHLMPPAETETN